YGTHANLKEAFLAFVERIPFYGLAVLCLDHPDVQDLLPRVRHRHVTYGLSPQADYSAKDISFHGLETHFTTLRKGQSLGQFAVRMPGQHNVLNCLAAIAVADELEVPLDVCKEALATFHGVARRFTVVSEVAGIQLVDDYGHHPAEVIATLEAARRAYSGRVLVAFQPHRYTRTHLLFDEFTRAFNRADAVFLTNIYPAGEAPIAGVTSAHLAEGLRSHGHHSAVFIEDRNKLVEALANEAKPGDVVIALGAGDINKILPQIEAQLKFRLAGAKGGGHGGQ
ncbi:MAG TPA: cyanophycin synthetase, partial [Polyangiaceae bacterium]|nr:cyanophycin synthetase [Polyangiaceae bacterium]